MNFLRLLGLFGIHNLSFYYPLHELFFFLLHPPITPPHTQEIFFFFASPPPPLPNKFPNGLFLSNMDQN